MGDELKAFYEGYAAGTLEAHVKSQAVPETNDEPVFVLVMPFAKDAKGKLSFTYVDATKYAQHVQNLGITETPGILIVGDDNKKYLFSGAVSNADELKAFFEGYAAGTLEAHVKSQ